MTEADCMWLQQRSCLLLLANAQPGRKDQGGCVMRELAVRGCTCGAVAGGRLRHWWLPIGGKGREARLAQ